MGSSRSVERMRLKQTQEIELAKSVREIDGVISARVHLALPEKSVFVRNQLPPTASVFVQLPNGRSMASGQVNAIIHLVSSSIPKFSSPLASVLISSSISFFKIRLSFCSFISVSAAPTSELIFIL